MNSIAIIINPVSGKNEGAKFFNILQNAPIVKDSNLKFFLTKKPLDATNILKDISNKFDRIIICGGDGTLHEAINGFDISSHSLLGLIPIGSGNDFSLSFHPKKIEPLALLEYYLSESPSIRSVDFGDIQIKDEIGKIFQKRMLNSFGVGFDAKVAFYSQRNKTFSGSLSYIYAIVKALFEFNQIKVKAVFDEQEIESEALFCAVGNGKSIGGGLYLMPNGVVDDGILNLSIIILKSRLKLLFMLPKAISNSLAGKKELLEYSFKRLNLTLEAPFYAHIDGEIITDKAKNISVTLSSQKLNFMCKQV